MKRSERKLTGEKKNDGEKSRKTSIKGLGLRFKWLHLEINMKD